MSSRRSNGRLVREYKAFKKDPPPYILAEPLPENILEWHYVIHGLPTDSPYHGGFYHGKLVFPSSYPLKPPSIYIITPNGRFKENTRLCLSISDFHPDTWNPAWSVETVLKGLLSFMLEDTSTLGSIVTTEAEKKRLAKHSLVFNLRDTVFCELFPEIAEEMREILRHKLQGESRRNDNKTAPSNSSKPELTFRSLIILTFILVPIIASIFRVILNTAP